MLFCCDPSISVMNLGQCYIKSFSHCFQLFLFAEVVGEIWVPDLCGLHYGNLYASGRQSIKICWERKQEEALTIHAEFKKRKRKNTIGSCR